MAHDTFSTRGGEFGFSIRFADGGEMTERNGTWDEVPKDRPIQSVGLSNLNHGVDYVRLDGFAKYFFSNEAMALKSSPDKQHHSAKILGGVDANGTVREAYLDFSGPKPTRSAREYPVAALAFGEAALRPGAA